MEADAFFYDPYAGRIKLAIEIIDGLPSDQVSKSTKAELKLAVLNNLLMSLLPPKAQVLTIHDGGKAEH